METTTRRLRVKRGAEQWRVLVSRFDGSGLSVAEFCAREGISFPFFESREIKHVEAALGLTPAERAVLLSDGYHA